MMQRNDTMGMGRRPMGMRRPLPRVGAPGATPGMMGGPTPPWERARQLRTELAPRIRDPRQPMNVQQAKQIFDTEMAKAAQQWRQHLSMGGGAMPQLGVLTRN